MSWVYYLMTQDLQPEDRDRLDRALMPIETQVINDPMLHESMQGMVPPAWWSDEPVSGVIRVDIE